MVKSALVACLALGACGTFEDRNVVIDLRILAMTADPPEQVIDLPPHSLGGSAARTGTAGAIDLPPHSLGGSAARTGTAGAIDLPPHSLGGSAARTGTAGAIDITTSQDPTALLPQVVPANVCALVTDPNFERRLRFELTLCVQDGGRCDPDAPRHVIAAGLIDDPDLTIPKPKLCGTIQPGRDLFEVVAAALEEEAFRGLAGVQYGVQLRIGGEQDDPALDLYAFKSLAMQPNIPAERMPNSNPTIRALTASVDANPEVPLALARCAEATTPLVLAPGQKARITPLEPDEARETYPIPTLDGQTRQFSESLTYQWVVNGGELSRGDTGGPHDRFGNPATLFTDFTAPPSTAGTDVSLWVIQRDERLGAAWFETCIRIVP